MDIQRPATNKRRNRNIALIASAAAGFILLTFLAISFAGRPPGVDRDIVFDGEVTRGEFIHEITAAGNFYAPEIRSVTNHCAPRSNRTYPSDSVTPVGTDRLHEPSLP